METHLQRLLTACNYIFGLPVEVEELDDPTDMLPYLAVPAIALSLLTLLLWLLTGVTLPPLGGMLIGAVLIGALWLGASRGQNLLALGDLATYVEHRWLAGNDDGREPIFRQVIVSCLVVVKLASLGILVYQGQWQWLVLIPLAGIFYSMEMSIHLGYIPADSPAFRRLHILTLIIFFVASLAMPLKGPFFIAFLWLLTFVIGKWASQQEEELGHPLVNGGTEATECLFLVLALIFMS